MGQSNFSHTTHWLTVLQSQLGNLLVNLLSILLSIESERSQILSSVFVILVKYLLFTPTLLNNYYSGFCNGSNIYSHTLSPISLTTPAKYFLCYPTKSVVNNYYCGSCNGSNIYFHTSSPVSLTSPANYFGNILILKSYVILQNLFINAVRSGLFKHTNIFIAIKHADLLISKKHLLFLRCSENKSANNNS